MLFPVGYAPERALSCKQSADCGRAGFGALRRFGRAARGAFQDQVQGAVEKQLAAKGLELSPSGTPDLLIHYHASISQRIDVYSSDQEYGYGGDCKPYVYDAGTLLIDFVDTRTNKIVWRGWAEGSMDGFIDNQAWMEKRIEEAVTRIFERFPRRL